MEPQQTEPNNQPAQAPAAEPAKPLARLPDKWPGGFGVYKYSKEAVKRNFWTLAGFFVLSVVIGSLLSYKGGFAGDIISALLSALASGGYVLAFLAGIRGEQLPFGDAFKKALPYTLKLFVLGLLVSVSLLVSLVLLVIPFFFVLPRLSLANYFLVDKNMGILEAYKASWKATKGNAMKVWAIYAVNILFVLLCITIIGIPFGIYLLVMYSAALAVLYELLNHNPAPQAAEAAPAQAPEEESQPETNPEPGQSEEPPANPAPPAA